MGDCFMGDSAPVVVSAIVEFDDGTVKDSYGSRLTGILRNTPGRGNCFVLVERDGLRYTLVLSLGWVDIANELQRVSGRPDDADLPRAAIQAVVKDWPRDWRHDLAEPSIAISHDGVPHIGFDPDSRLV